jgi:hypothetical protein
MTGYFAKLTAQNLILNNHVPITEKRLGLFQDGVSGFKGLIFELLAQPIEHVGLLRN